MWIILNKQLREVKAEVESLKTQIENNKKDVKVTEKRELETTVDVLTEECKRLTKILKEVMKKKHDNKVLEEENYRIVKAYKRKEDEIEELKQEIYELKNSINKMDEGMAGWAKLKKLVKDKDKTILKLKKEIIKKNKQFECKIIELKEKIEKVESINKKLK